MKYAIVEDGAVINVAAADAPLGDGWIEWQAGVEIGDLFDGEAFSKPEPVVAVPTAVPALKAKLALLNAGLFTAAEDAINSLPSPEKEAALIYWNGALNFERDHPLIAQIGAALELDDEAIDALFIAAAAI